MHVLVFVTWLKPKRCELQQQARGMSATSCVTQYSCSALQCKVLLSAYLPDHVIVVCLSARDVFWLVHIT